METLELALVDEVKPGKTYQSLHASTLTRIASVLVDHNICKGEPADLIERNIPQLFMPHGVGHLLGIQVHDVAGHQSDINGTILSPPENSPALRNTRLMEVNMVFTVEPGLYFIPLILEAERCSDRGKLINWNTIDELYPCGGIRIEDNIRVTSDGAENLTRQFE
jgi:Xaa-Pro dipeptidase